MAAGKGTNPQDWKNRVGKHDKLQAQPLSQPIRSEKPYLKSLVRGKRKLTADGNLGRG
jgi:hypothetical protein